LVFNLISLPVNKLPIPDIIELPPLPPKIDPAIEPIPESREFLEEAFLFDLESFEDNCAIAIFVSLSNAFSEVENILAASSRYCCHSC
jgi:hypothetical protein